MSDENYENLIDLNQVALEELRSLIDDNCDLNNEWKEAIYQLIENGIPQNLEDFEDFVWSK